jgi:hypothetical protein
MATPETGCEAVWASGVVKNTHLNKEANVMLEFTARQSLGISSLWPLDF